MRHKRITPLAMPAAQRTDGAGCVWLLLYVITIVVLALIVAWWLTS